MKICELSSSAHTHVSWRKATGIGENHRENIRENIRIGLITEHWNTTEFYVTGGKKKTMKRI